VAEFLSLLKVVALCGTTFFLVFVILLALPHSKLRSVCMEFMKYILAAGLFLMVPSPIDIVPDVVPVVGWADDLGYLLAGIGAIKSARGDRRRREFEQELDDAYRAKMARLSASDDSSEGGSHDAA
jgi:uncharacterized membrane protein YkvA (DUF1232 family)